MENKRFLTKEDAKKLYFKQIRNLTLHEISNRMFNPEELKNIFAEQKENIDAGMGKIKVLVVDDEPHIVNLIKLSLNSDDYEIIEAYSGQEAIELAIKNQPHIITMDVMMPNMDGFQVCRELRKIPVTKNIPIMILSAKDALHDKFDGIDAGAIDYLTKPFDPAELNNRIKTNLDRSS